MRAFEGLARQILDRCTDPRACKTEALQARRIRQGSYALPPVFNSAHIHLAKPCHALIDHRDCHLGFDVWQKFPAATLTPHHLAWFIGHMTNCPPAGTAPAADRIEGCSTLSVAGHPPVSLAPAARTAREDAALCENIEGPAGQPDLYRCGRSAGL